MKAVFADTFYFLALLNRNDLSHRRAIAASQVGDQSYVTTEFVLLELADALSKPPLREDFKSICALIESTNSFQLIRANSELLHRGLTLFFDRPDKAWQLTDCISFVVMRDQGIKEALTGDRHFEQAGFRALLRPAVD